MCQVNNPVTFSGKLMGLEEFLNRMVEALGIKIDVVKEDLVKWKAKL